MTTMRLGYPDGRIAGHPLLPRPKPPEIKPPFARPAFAQPHNVTPFGKGPPAARLKDKISHASLLAKLALAAAVIVVAVAVVAVVVATGGAALVVAGAAAAASMAAAGAVTLAGAAAVGAGLIVAGGAVAAVGKFGLKAAGHVEGAVADAGDDSPLKNPMGAIMVAEPKVITNSLPQGHTKLSLAPCSKEYNVPIPIAQGSDSVFVKSQGAARKGDKLKCGAIIGGPCSPNVFIGGGKKDYLRVDDDFGGFRAVFNTMDYIGTRVTFVGIGLVGGAAIAGGSLLAIGTAAIEMTAVMQLGPWISDKVSSGIYGAAGLVGAEDALITKLFADGVGTASSTANISLFGKTPKVDLPPGTPKAIANGKAIDLNIDGRLNSAIKGMSGKDVGAGLKHYDAAVSAKIVNSLSSARNGVNKAVLTALLAGKLNLGVPAPKAGAHIDPPAIISPAKPVTADDFNHITLKPKPSADTAAAPRIEVSKETGTFSLKSVEATGGATPPKPTITTTLKDGHPSLETGKHEFMSVKASKTSKGFENSQRHAGDHNNPDLKVHYGDFNNNKLLKLKPGQDNFNTSRKVDMDNLSSEDVRIAKHLRNQGRSKEDIQMLLESSTGKNAVTRDIEDGETFYGFQNKEAPAKADDNMFWIDEKGFKDVESKFFKDGAWDRQGVKTYLALPCHNSVDTINTGSFPAGTKGKVVETVIGEATETLPIRDQLGRFFSRQFNIMSGGGTQVTPPPGLEVTPIGN